MLYRDPTRSYSAANTYYAAIISTTRNFTTTISINFSTKTGNSTKSIDSW